MPSPNESTLDLRDCRIRLLRGGEGEPLLYLHGEHETGDWPDFLQRLSGSFDVVTPDHPGFGGSDLPDWLDNADDLVCFYLDLLDRLELEQVHLVGNSIGGWVAAALASRNATRLRSLTLLAAAGLYVDEAPPGDIFIWSPEELLGNLYYDQAIAATTIAQAHDGGDIDLVLKNRFTTARLGWQPRLHDPDLHKWLHRIQLPTLILWGEEDRVLPPAYAAAYHQRIAGSRRIMLPRCGHLPHRERPAETAAAIMEFLAEVG
jgi:pimeloyl-ACP methyl ester carboxylesterase